MLSDLTINSAKFQPAVVSKEHRETLDAIKSIPRDEPWWEIGILEYRRREASSELRYNPTRLEGRTPMMRISSRDSGRLIPCRILYPNNVKANSGVLLNIHGGGWSVFGYDFQDPYLQHLADKLNLVCMSVQYRRAPECPFPQGPEDCFDVAQWLIVNARKEFQCDFTLIDGSSSGAHFAALTAIHLRKTHPEFNLRGVIFKYGIFDLTYSNPSIVNAKDPFIVTHDSLKHTTEAFIPETTLEDRRHPSSSPFYADLQSLSPLPPALFLCGTEDMLIDDSVFFSAKWMMVEASTVLKIFPGGLHGFVDFNGFPFMQDGWEAIVQFLNRCLGEPHP